MSRSQDLKHARRLEQLLASQGGQLHESDDTADYDDDEEGSVTDQKRSKIRMAVRDEAQQIIAAAQAFGQKYSEFAGLQQQLAEDSYKLIRLLDAFVKKYGRHNFVGPVGGAAGDALDVLTFMRAKFLNVELRSHKALAVAKDMLAALRRNAFPEYKGL